MNESKDVLMLLAALKELVELKEMKDKYGKNDEYLKRQPLAWITAKRLVKQFKNYGVKA